MSLQACVIADKFTAHIRKAIQAHDEALSHKIAEERAKFYIDYEIGKVEPLGYYAAIIEKIESEGEGKA